MSIVPNSEALFLQVTLDLTKTIGIHTVDSGIRTNLKQWTWVIRRQETLLSLPGNTFVISNSSEETDIQERFLEVFAEEDVELELCSVIDLDIRQLKILMKSFLCKHNF